jgi:protein-S-isoprenylcysteine O-methyltransferase Ste14
MSPSTSSPRIPPVAIVLGFGIVMALVARAWPQSMLLPGTARYLLVALLAAAAVAVVGVGLLGFRRARTTVNPLRPEQAQALVRSGVYRFSRNPMYLGMLLALGAWCTWLGNPLNLLLLPLFVMAMNRLQIVHEERALAERFPEQFADYRRQVRRWL